MTTTASPPRRRLGERLAPFQLDTLAHGRLDVPSEGRVHLQFRRFSGCPVCNLQLRRFARAQDQLRAAGVTTVSFFYSSREAMLPYQAELPFPVVPDPQRRWYGAFGVERSVLAVADPRVWASAIGGLLSGPTNPLEGGAQDGLPADFLVASSGELIGLKYGARADDQWSVEEVLALASRVP